MGQRITATPAALDLLERMGDELCDAVARWLR